MPPEIKPFEMPGRMGPTLWRSDGNDKQIADLDACFGKGVGFISFDSGVTAGTWEEKLVTWNPSHTEAALWITTTFGGTNGTGTRIVVRKFGDDWVVVSLKAELAS